MKFDFDSIFRPSENKKNIKGLSERELRTIDYSYIISQFSSPPFFCGVVCCKFGGALSAKNIDGSNFGTDFKSRILIQGCNYMIT